MGEQSVDVGDDVQAGDAVTPSKVSRREADRLAARIAADNVALREALARQQQATTSLSATVTYLLHRAGVVAETIPGWAIDQIVAKKADLGLHPNPDGSFTVARDVFLIEPRQWTCPKCSALCDVIGDVDPETCGGCK